MALQWNVRPERPLGMIADRDICLDKTATRLVPAGSAESAFQLVNAGREIPEEEVARLGLVVIDGRVEQKSEQPESSEPETEAHGKDAS